MNDEELLKKNIEAVLASVPCSVTLPAGTGKTELISAAAAEIASRGGTSLVLTHTHAGVDALRQRMRKFGVGRDHVVIRTIDSWSFDLIAHFPDLAELSAPAVPDWRKSAEYHLAAARATHSNAVARMLRASYAFLFVDEYQDCLVDQHELVKAIAVTVPTAVFGDPLQSLLNFGPNRPVDWNEDVLPSFPMLTIPSRPRRWEPDHLSLGTWLTEVRKSLSSEMPIDLSHAPITWERRINDRTYVGVCNKALREGGRIAILGRYRPDCVSAANRLKGAYTVMEAMDEKKLTDSAKKLDAGDGASVAFAVVEFAISCCSGLAAHIPSAKRKRLAEGKSFSVRNPQLQPAYGAVLKVRDDPSPANIRVAFDLLCHLPDVCIYCLEAWKEVVCSVAIADTDKCTVLEALNKRRSNTRAVGRRSARRVVSRPLLVKGLEYDHVIILKPEDYSAQELYVALTRGSKSVTVISDTMVLPPAKMAGRKA